MGLQRFNLRHSVVDSSQTRSHLTHRSQIIEDVHDFAMILDPLILSHIENTIYRVIRKHRQSSLWKRSKLRHRFRNVRRCLRCVEPCLAGCISSVGHAVGTVAFLNGDGLPRRARVVLSRFTYSSNIERHRPLSLEADFERRASRSRLTFAFLRISRMAGPLRVASSDLLERMMG